MWVNLNIFVTAVATPLASQLMEAKTGDAGKGVLSVPLVPTGSAPGTAPTWYAGSGAVDAELAPMLFDATLIVSETEGAVTIEQAEWLLGNADITYLENESFEAACTRLGVERQREVEL